MIRSKETIISGRNSIKYSSFRHIKALGRKEKKKEPGKESLHFGNKVGSSKLFDW